MTPSRARSTTPVRHRRGVSTWRPLALVLGVAFSALIAVIVFIACGTGGPVNTTGTIAAGTSVNGVDVGGLTRNQAEVKLVSALPDPGAGKLTINIGTLSSDVTYASVGRAYDFDAIMQAAFSNGGAVEAKTSYDANALGQQVNDFVATAQAAPVNATITFENGQYVLTAAVDGRSVDAAAVLANAGTLMGNGNPADQVLDVEVTAVPADINSDAAQAAIDRAEGVIALPLTITAAGTTYTVDSATLRTWITLVQTTPGVWDLTVDDAAVTTYINTIKAQVDQPAVDAEWSFGSGAEPIVTPSQTGYELDAVAAVLQVEAALAAAQPGVPIPPIALTVLMTEPEFTTAEAHAAAGEVGLLGTWTTHYIPSTFNGNGINIRRPAALIDGTVIQAGDVFDFYRLTGPYTEGNGYTDGAAIVGGKTKGEGVLGGGLCSASTTVFNAALRAGFQMGQRYNHGYYITRYPVGLDATIWVSGSSVKNMTFTNDSDYPIVIRSISKKRSITFQVWGVGDGRTVNLSDPVVTNEVEAFQWYEFTDELAPRQTERTEFGADGFDAVVNRTVRDANGNVIHSDTFRSDYKRTDGIVLVGRYPGDPPDGDRIPYTNELPPAPGPTPSPTPGPVTGPPDASFTPTPAAGNPLKIKLSNTTTTSGVTTYHWDFDDGTEYDGANPVAKEYSSPGTYTITLTATNSAGSDVASHEVTVTGGGSPEPTTPTPTPSPTPTPAEPTATLPEGT